MGWGGEGGKEEAGRGGVIDEGDSKGRTSAHTQLSEPDQLDFIRNLRAITARSLERKKKPSVLDSGPCCVRDDPLRVTGSSLRRDPKDHIRE